MNSVYIGVVSIFVVDCIEFQLHEIETCINKNRYALKNK